MSYDTVKYDVVERVAAIALNRPDRLNAFTVQICVELLDAFDQADNDDAVRVVICPWWPEHPFK